MAMTAVNTEPVQTQQMGRQEVMKLTAGTRNEIADKDFALPGRRYPIENEDHARAALSMLHNASPAEQATIRAKVHGRYPNIGQSSSSADILTRRKAKPEPQAPAAKPTADILMRRKK